MRTVLLLACLSLSGAICAAQTSGATTAKATAREANDAELISCVKKGDAACVAQSLARGANADAANEEGVSALILASEGTSAQVVRLLLSAGAGVNKARSGEGTPLCRAALFGREKNAEILLDAGAKINVVCDADHGDTPLMDALRGAMLAEMPAELKEEFTSADGEGNDDGKSAVDAETKTADKAKDERDTLRDVMNTPGEEFLAVARLLLKRGADVNVVATCDVGETALLYAATSANAELVEELLAHGAKVDAGASPLEFMREFESVYVKDSGTALPALSKEQAAMLEWNRRTMAARERIRRLLKAAGAKEDREGDGQRDAKEAADALDEAANDAFASAIKKNDIEDLERLVKAYAGHPLGARALPSALRTAVIYDRAAMVKLLLAWGVDPNDGGYTALMHAAHDNKLEYVRMLLDAGANVNATDDDGRTALDCAEAWAGSGEEQTAVIELLKARGAKRGKRQ